MAEEQKTNDLPEVENIDMQEELTKLEDEINTLKQVRAGKKSLVGTILKESRDFRHGVCECEFRFLLQKKLKHQN